MLGMLYGLHIKELLGGRQARRVHIGQARGAPGEEEGIAERKVAQRI